MTDLLILGQNATDNRSYPSPLGVVSSSNANRTLEITGSLFGASVILEVRGAGQAYFSNVGTYTTTGRFTLPPIKVGSFVRASMRGVSTFTKVNIGMFDTAQTVRYGVDELRVNYPFICRKTAAAIGDSLTANGLFINGTTKNFTAAGYISWIRNLTKQQVDFPPENVFAAVGYTTSQMISAGYHLSAAALQASFVFIHAGTNDYGVISTDQTIANLQAMYDAVIIGSSAIVVAIPILPRTSGVSQRALDRGRINDFIRRTARTNPRVILANPGAKIADATDSNGQPLAGYLYDGLHTNATGGRLVGQGCVDAITPYIALFDPLFVDPADLYDTTNPTGNLITNGLLTGTSGTTGVNGSLSGQVATSWNVNGASASGIGTIAAVCSKVARTDGLPGSWQQVVVSGTPTTVYAINTSQNVTFSKLSVGDTIELMLETEIDAGSANFLGLTPNFTVLSTANTTLTDMSYGSLTTDFYSNSGVIIKQTHRSQRYTIKADDTAIGVNLYAYFGANVAASATYRLGRVSLRKIA